GVAGGSWVVAAMGGVGRRIVRAIFACGAGATSGSRTGRAAGIACDAGVVGIAALAIVIAEPVRLGSEMLADAAAPLFVGEFRPVVAIKRWSGGEVCPINIEHNRFRGRRELHELETLPRDGHQLVAHAQG